mmetsp:Transcript_20776/g.43685  ORF Transcript_20776/g.43685 Transcript_20776/m.43685 type:complete len:94 (+) Transcript_20776:1742-2023(+)
MPQRRENPNTIAEKVEKLRETSSQDECTTKALFPPNDIGDVDDDNKASTPDHTQHQTDWPQGDLLFSPVTKCPLLPSSPSFLLPIRDLDHQSS